MNFKSYTVHEIDELSRTGIYAIVNKVNGKFYIGSAGYICEYPSHSGFYTRWKNHVHDLNLNEHGNPHLQNAWNKYGADAFKFQILEFVESDKCIEIEQTYLDLFPVGDRGLVYNICFTAGSTLGRKHSTESRRKMSESQKGKKLSIEARKNRGKSFTLVSPEGEVKESNNISLFAQENNIDRSGLHHLTCGDLFHFNGWTTSLEAHQLYLETLQNRGVGWSKSDKRWVVTWQLNKKSNVKLFKLKEDAIKFRNDLEEEGITFRVLCMNWRKKLENATQK